MANPINSGNLAIFAAQSLPALGFFPYCVICVSPAFYQILLMPRQLDESQLYALALQQVRANRLEICLVLNRGAAYYFDESGQSTLQSAIPRGGLIAERGFWPAWDCVQDAGLARRTQALRAYAAQRNSGAGCLLGNLSKGGRSASAEELRRFDGCNAAGVLNGLQQCRRCGYWAGNCLDPSPQFAGQLMHVDCLCANQNRCARCGQLLYRYKLNANFYDAKDGQIWHVPGFCGLAHRCGKRG